MISTQTKLRLPTSLIYVKLPYFKQVIEEFKYAVVPRLDELEKGVIHGDVNEMNILVSPKPGAR